MKLLTLIFTLITISSCGNSKNTYQMKKLPSETLQGEFVIKSINNSVVSKSDLTVYFNENESTISGFSGCNQFTGKFILNSNTIKIGPLASTRMLCSEEKNEVETSLLKALSEVTSFELNNDSLKLKNDDTNLIIAVKKQNEILITYQALTRGFFEKIWINQQFINFSNDYNLDLVQKVACPIEDWNELLNLIDSIDVKSLQKLEAPSNTNHYDAAPAATLEITTNNNTYKTPIFDHGNPPKSIEDIVNKILSMKKMVNKK